MFSYRTMKTNGFKVISCFIISTKLKYFLPGNLSLDNVWLMSRKLGKNYVLEIAGLIQNILKRTIPLLQNSSPKLKCFLKKSFLIQVDFFVKKKKKSHIIENVWPESGGIKCLPGTVPDCLQRKFQNFPELKLC